MSSISLNFSFDLSGIADIQGIVDKQVMPAMRQAVNAVGTQLAINWQQEVLKAKLWSEERDAYAQSIKWTMSESGMSGYAEATYKLAEEIETGRPPRDLKKMLNTSAKVRRTESGKRFLVIPMRQSMKKLQSAGLYGAAKSLEASSVVSAGKRASGEVTHLSPKAGMTKASKQTPFLSSVSSKKAMMVGKNNYSWGGKLTAKQAGEHKWAQGLTRFNTSAGKGKSSSYMSFRIMMEGQSGWVIPAQPGLFIAKKVVDDMRPKAEKAFSGAIEMMIPKKA